MPPLTRQTTYSSLPPSPRYEDYDFPSKNAGVGVKEFEEALGRLGGLRRSSVSASAVPLAFTRNGLGGSVVDAKGKGRVLEREEETKDGDGLSMWYLLRDEVGVEDWDGWIVDGKWERIANFLAVPLAVEKVRSRLFNPHLCSCLGNAIRSTPMPGRFFVQFHHPPHPIHLRLSPNHIQWHIP